jgi:predicted PurR-regulated permease PerM
MKYSDLENSTKIILKVFGVALALVFLWLIRDIIVILLLSIIFASAMEPLVRYFKLRKVPRAASVLAVYVIVLAVAGAVVSLLIPPVLSQFSLLSDNLPQYTEQFRSQFPVVNELMGGIDLGDAIKQIFSTVNGGESVLNRTVGVFNGFFTFITVLVISFYLVAEEKGMREFIRSLVPPHYQEFTMGLVDSIQKKMGLWLLGQLILSVSIFLMTFLGLSLLGVKYALFLALLAGLLEVIPYIGPFVSAVPAIFFAFIQNPALAIAVLVLYIIIQKVEGYVLVPKVMEKTVGVSPLAVLLALLIGFKLAGVLGLLLAVPLVGAFTVVINEFASRPNTPHTP